MGLSYHTVNRHLEYLEGAFLIRRLQPYHANLTKRLVKSPKVYWRDTGLLHSLLNVPDTQRLLAQPWVGASWEGFVIEQMLQALAMRDVHPGAFFFRTSDGIEIDLVLDFGTCKWAIEVKITSAPGPGDMARLRQAADLIHAERRILVSQVRESTSAGHDVSCNLPWWIEHLSDLLP
jgi:predicted AAA+ superfamily ATPase